MLKSESKNLFVLYYDKSNINEPSYEKKVLRALRQMNISAHARSHSEATRLVLLAEVSS